MAFEYLNTYACPVRKRFKDRVFVEECKSLHGVVQIFSALRAEGHSDKDILAKEVNHVVNRRGQQEVRTSKVKRLKKRAEKFLKWAKHCKDCPANAGGAHFGCYGAIHYPIGSAEEEWIMEQFRGSAEPMDSFVQHLIETNNIDGMDMAQARMEQMAAGDGPAMNLYERSHAVSRTFEGEDGESRSISSDQLFQLMMGMGHWEPNTMVMFLKDFGAVDAEKADDAGAQAMIMDAMAGMPKVPLARPNLGKFLLPFPASPDHPAGEFVAFLHALHVAYKCGATMITDG
jgi:hypothetical protein